MVEAWNRRIVHPVLARGRPAKLTDLLDVTTALDPNRIARIDEGKYDNAEGEAPPPTQGAFRIK